jgi:hypothetical protein
MCCRGSLCFPVCFGRRIDRSKRDYDTPISYDWKTDDEKKRGLVNSDRTKVKFGIRLPGSGPRNVSPGPAAYYPQPSPVTTNTNPEFDKLGRKLVRSESFVLTCRHVVSR